jgi:hypothetical protein
MQTTSNPKLDSLESLSVNDRQKLIDVFAWLIKEDKKHNPELYVPRKAEND